MDRWWPLFPSPDLEYEWDGNRGRGLRRNCTADEFRVSCDGFEDTKELRIAYFLGIFQTSDCLARRSTVICGHRRLEY